MIRKSKIIMLISVFSVIILLSWYVSSNQMESVDVISEPITVEFINEAGEQIGKALLAEENGAVSLTVNVHGLSPGEHGFHFHEVGVCEKPEFESAGGHFNPADKKHGFNHPEGYHAGDMKNVWADSNGEVNSTLIVDHVNLEEEGNHSLLDEDGTSIVIHQLSDDYISDPSGNSGSRIACGTIK
ncbi:superoxide dismutase family protein [Chengkuizengella axinellae]|uniref:Superoxide dismutase [Cu-Zn] n=1 Tax=Chengkuizengella axinellae TaxID=3064388 RepID=A0ABT9J041_9BACL|nr:superoxide dismutase family protein [Chengkuizengella sp. 2205SS18-9]MDP5274394.1 superoxide dismutase family protein [Chengkuizengella sp. 2205SS18-9]